MTCIPADVASFTRCIRQKNKQTDIWSKYYLGHSFKRVCNLLTSFVESGCVLFMPLFCKLRVISWKWKYSTIKTSRTLFNSLRVLPDKTDDGFDSLCIAANKTSSVHGSAILCIDRLNVEKCAFSVATIMLKAKVNNHTWAIVVIFFFKGSQFFLRSITSYFARRSYLKRTAPFSKCICFKVALKVDSSRNPLATFQSWLFRNGVCQAVCMHLYQEERGEQSGSRHHWAKRKTHWKHAACQKLIIKPSSVYNTAERNSKSLCSPWALSGERLAFLNTALTTDAMAM